MSRSKKDKLREIWEADPNFSRVNAMRELHLSERTLYRYLRTFQSSLNLNNQKSNRKITPKNSNLRTLSVTALIDSERLDIKKIIRDGISELPSGEVAYDDNFRRDLQIADTRWREYSRDDEFSDFRATLPNRKVVWGSRATINQIRKIDGVV